MKKYVLYSVLFAVEEKMKNKIITACFDSTKHRDDKNEYSN